MSQTLDSLFPLIVCRDDETGMQAGSVRMLKHPALALTWVHADEDDGFLLYFTHEEAAACEAAGIDYHAAALKNLRRRSPQLFTHNELDEHGQTLFAACLHEDGFGSSRLLLVKDVLAESVRGMLFALPERGCAMVLGPDKAADETVLQWIEEYYQEGGIPMLQGLFDPQLFDLED